MMDQGWAKTLADGLCAAGLRVTPTTRGGGGFKNHGHANGESYPYDQYAHNYVRAAAVSLVLGDLILLDYDGNKPGVQPPRLDQLPDLIGGALPPPAQWNTEGNSLHFVFRLPAGVDVSKLHHHRDGILAQGIDIKRGNQLLHFKPHKYHSLPTLLAAPEAPAKLVDVLTRREVEQQTAEAIPFDGIENARAREAFNRDVQQFAEQTEGGRNNALNNLTLRYMSLAYAGELDPVDVEARIREAAAVNGCEGVNATFASANSRAEKQPRKFDTGCVDVVAAFAGVSGRVKEIVSRVQQFAGGASDQALAVLRDILELPPGLERAMLLDDFRSTAGVKRGDALDLEIRRVTRDSENVPARQIDGEYGKKDGANAALYLARRHPGDSLALVDGEPFCWDGSRWVKQDAQSWLRRDIARDMLALSGGDAMSNRAACAATLVESVIEQNPAARSIGRTPAHYVCFRNGVLDVAGWVWQPHDKDNGNVNALAYDYRLEAACPTWESFLLNTFEGDHERVALLQEWFGYNLVRSYAHHKIMLMIGKTRSGKGTIGRVLEELVGTENYSGGSLSALVRDEQLANLDGKLAYFVGDAERSVSGNIRSLVVEKLKTISGYDTLTFNRKYLKAKTARLPARITIAANEVPAMFDDSGALAGRLLILPFNKSFLGNEDLTLSDRLSNEIEGIAIWALHGLERLSRCGKFTEPAASELTREDINRQFSPLQEFVADCVAAKEGSLVLSGEMYDAYCNWATVNGEQHVANRHAFHTSVGGALPPCAQYDRYTTDDGRRSRGWKGISIRNVK